MIYDSLMMTAVTEELTRTMSGGKIERVTQPVPLEVILRIYTERAKHDLLLSCEPEAARAHVTVLKRENPPQPYPFCSVLRKYIDGAKILAFDRPSGFGERLLALRCQAYDGAPYNLIVEIMGKYSNIILLSGADMILGAAKHVTSDINRYREVLPGRPYLPPPKQRTKRNPLEPFFPPHDDPLTEEDGAAWLLKTFQGVSPLLAREAALRASPHLTQQTLYNAMSEIIATVRERRYAPVIWTDEFGTVQGAYPVPLLSVPERYQQAYESMSVALDGAAASIGKRTAFDSARTSLTAAMHRSRRRREQDLEDIERGLANAGRADEYQQTGDLLQTYRGELERSVGSLILDDYYATGDAPARRTISIDPALSLRENAERYFKKASKARASRTALEERRDAIKDELRLLDQAEVDIVNTTTEEAVEDIHERVAGVLSRADASKTQVEPGTSDRDAPPRFEGHKIRAYRSVDNWEILVGENATSNDYLTTKVASPSDIWLHVRAATSAHGVIRAQNRPASVSAAALRHAAELVAARSEVKHSSLIPVDYTLKKYVRKPRKSAPGSVVYQNEKTLYVNGIK